MRKEFRKKLKQQFGDAVRQHANGFSEMKIRSPFGEIVYAKITKPEKTGLFIIVFPDMKREAFTLELGWSRKGRFPELPFRPSGSPTQTRTEFAQPEFVCRLANLLGLDDYWWLVQPVIDPLNDDYVELLKASVEPISAEEAELVVKPHVEDAIQKLVEFGLPYLEEYLRANTR